MAKKINRIFRGGELPTGWPCGSMLFAAIFSAGIAPAMAAVDLSGGATIGVEHNSNPIALSDRQAQDYLTRGVIKSQDDTVKRLTANVAGKTAVNEPTQLQLQASYSKLENIHFNTLDHSEYNFAGDLDWKPSQAFDAALLGSQSRVPVELNDIGGQAVVQKTSSHVESTLRLRPTPSWQFSLTPSWYELKLPLPGSGNFKLNESSGSVGLGYLGAGSLVPGFFVTESQGRYSGIDNATRYEQRGLGISLNYRVTAFSSFSLSAGQAKRTTHLIEPSKNPQAVSLEGTQSDVTGSLAYQRELSVKTSIHVSVFRNFQPYTVGVNTTVGTGSDGGITWNPTSKLSAKLDGGFVRVATNGLELTPTVNVREDLERHLSLGVKYLATRQMSLSTFLTRSVHNSNVRYGVFNQTIAGLELTVSVD